MLYRVRYPKPGCFECLVEADSEEEAKEKVYVGKALEERESEYNGYWSLQENWEADFVSVLFCERCSFGY